MPGGSITVSNGAGDTLVVDIASGVWKANAALSGDSVSFPDTITTTKTYYTGTDRDDIVVSVLRRGLEVANTPDGTRTVNIQEGKNLTFTPGPDPSKAIAAGELFDADAGALVIPEVAYDDEDPPEALPPANDAFALAVDENGALVFYDGAEWVEVSLVSHDHDDDYAADDHSHGG
jgi:hypothetical protein